jgi:hypothetical protein
MALGTTDISVSLIKATLGESSNKISELCKSSKINKWSKFKPVNIITNNWNTREEFLHQLKNVFYGFNKEEIVSSSLSQIINNAKLYSGDWNYIKPTAYFRCMYFTGYEHSAGVMVNIRNKILTSSSGVFTVAAYVDIAASLTLEDIALSINNSLNGWKYAIIYRKINEVGDPNIVFGSTLIKDGALNELLSCTVTLPSAGDYDIVPVITLATSQDTVQDTFYLPLCNFQHNYSFVNYIVQVFPYMPNAETPPIFNIVRDSNGYVLSFDYKFCAANYDKDISKTATIYLKIYAAGEQLAMTLSQSVTMPVNSSVYHTFHIDFPTSETDDVWSFTAYFNDGSIKYIDLRQLYIQEDFIRPVILSKLLEDYLIN